MNDPTREAVERLISEIPGVKPAREIWELQDRVVNTLRALLDRAETAERQLAEAEAKGRREAQAEIDRLREAFGRVADYLRADMPLEALGTARAALIGDAGNDRQPRWRIVTAPVAGPSPHVAWCAYSPERPGVGKHYADTEAAARAKCAAALRVDAGE